MATEDAVLRFASFELDVRSRELRRGTTCVRLQEQPFEILRMMLERPGEVVTRDELARRLWPTGTFVDFEHSLNAAVKRLRAALGDDADRPSYVETLPRRGYRFIAPLALPVRVPSAPAERVRLAVLPFTNLSGDSGQEYFSDGLTDEMIAQLGRLGRGRIGVIARWSSMVFKGTGRRAREIGEALRADYLLEGSVRRDGDKVRISAWLVETAGETHLWSDTYERHLHDCLAVQADVATRIVQSLSVELGGEPMPEAVAPPPTPAAAQMYLKGRYYWNMPASEGLEQAVAHFTQALEIDPSFAAAAASLARACVSRAEYYTALPRDAFEQAWTAAERALQLDPSISDAHLAMADIRRMRDWDWEGAEASYAQALALNPSSEAAHRLYGLLLAALARPAEAVRETRRARELDPLCLVVGSTSAWVSYLAGDYAEAIEQCGISLDLDPLFLPARRIRAAALLQSGQDSEAVIELEHAISLDSHDPVSPFWLAHATAITGARSAAAAMLRAVRRETAARHLPSYHVALVETALNDPDAAFASLERACEERDPGLSALAVEPRFEPLHGDRRFAALLERISLGRVTHPRHQTM